MQFTIKLSDNSLLTGEIVGDGGMVSSYERAQQLIRHRIARKEPLVMETFRDKWTGKFERTEVDPNKIRAVMLC